MKKFLMFAVVFVGFMIITVAVNRKKQATIQVVQSQVVSSTPKNSAPVTPSPSIPTPPVAPLPPVPSVSPAYKNGYNDGYFGTWLSPIRWTFGLEYRSGWSAGNYDRCHGKPNKYP